MVVVAVISRFASTLDGLRGGYLEDSTFATIAAADRQTGLHRNPTEQPAYFTMAYFHRPEEIADECAAVGLVHQATCAVEGIGWLLPDLDDRLTDTVRSRTLFSVLTELEQEPSMLGVSAHLLAVARAP